MTSPTEHTPGLLSVLVSAAAGAIRGAQRGVSLIQAEWAQEREHLLRSVAWVLWSALCLSIGALLLVAAGLWCLPEAWRPAAAAATGLAFWLAAMWGVFCLRRDTATRRRHALAASPGAS